MITVETNAYELAADLSASPERLVRYLRPALKNIGMTLHRAICRRARLSRRPFSTKRRGSLSSSIAPVEKAVGETR